MVQKSREERKQKVIEALNKARAMELHAIHQYMNQHYNLDNLDYGELAAKGMPDTIFRGPHAMPWAQPCGLSSKTGGTCHGHDYYDHMVVWSYPLAFAGQDIAAACAEGGFIDRLLKAGQ